MNGTQKRVHALANDVGKAYTDGEIPRDLAHHILTELTLISSALRFAKRDADKLARENANNYARAQGYY